MRIRIWNAYASNNSGSYTIVGSFSDEERASDVAGELAVVVAEHDRWHRQFMGSHAPESSDEPPPSPLAQFALAHGLNAEAGVGESQDDWPTYVTPTCPGVVSTGKQVLIHSPYTVSLPALFGEYFHKRGGRVALELDHAHAPIAVVFEIWWRRSSTGAPAPSDAIRSALRDELMQPQGVIAKHAAAAMTPQAWTPNDSHADLCIAAVLKDMIAGVAETSAVIRRAGAGHHLRLHELDATSATLLGGLRPPEPD